MCIPCDKNIELKIGAISIIIHEFVIMTQNLLITYMFSMIVASYILVWKLLQALLQADHSL